LPVKDGFYFIVKQKCHHYLFAMFYNQPTGNKTKDAIDSEWAQ
jgi:hypothetical protein